VKVGDFIDILGPRSFKLKVDKLEKISDQKDAITISKDVRERIPLSSGVKVFVRKSIR